MSLGKISFWAKLGTISALTVGLLSACVVVHRPYRPHYDGYHRAPHCRRVWRTRRICRRRWHGHGRRCRVMRRSHWVC